MRSARDPRGLAALEGAVVHRVLSFRRKAPRGRSRRGPDPRGRHGEADADVAGDGPEDRGGDAHQAAAQVEEAPAGVAGVDRGVDLDHRDALLVGAADRADDAGGDRVLEAEGAPDGEDAVALAQTGVGLLGERRRRGPRSSGVAGWRGPGAGRRRRPRRAIWRPSLVRMLTEPPSRMTWLLVTIRPEGASMTPLPWLLASSSPARRSGRARRRRRGRRRRRRSAARPSRRPASRRRPGARGPPSPSTSSAVRAPDPAGEHQRRRRSRRPGPGDAARRAAWARPAGPRRRRPAPDESGGSGPRGGGGSSGGRPGPRSGRGAIGGSPSERGRGSRGGRPELTS